MCGELRLKATRNVNTIRIKREIEGCGYTEWRRIKRQEINLFYSPSFNRLWPNRMNDDQHEATWTKSVSFQLTGPGLSWFAWMSNGGWRVRIRGMRTAGTQFCFFEQNERRKKEPFFLVGFILARTCVCANGKRYPTATPSPAASLSYDESFGISWKSNLFLLFQIMRFRVLEHMIELAVLYTYRKSGQGPINVY